MMIFDANSGEFWQIFARQGMRNLRNPLLGRGEVCIEDIELDLKSLDDIPALLIGLRYLARLARSCEIGQILEHIVNKCCLLKGSP